MSAGIETVGYLCLVYPHKMAENVCNLFNYAIDHLKNKETNKRIRCQLLTLAGNLSIANRSELCPRITTMLEQILAAFETIADIFTHSSVESEKNYAKTLRRSSLEFLMLTVHAICFQARDESCQILVLRIKEFLPLLFEFIHRMLDEEMEPDVVARLI